MELIVNAAHLEWNRSGRLDSALWNSAAWSSRFVDMASGEPALYETKCACVSTPEGLLFGIWAEDPYPKGFLTVEDSLIFQENDLEIFLDFGIGYYEFEINALGTRYEVLHIWRDSLAKLSPTIAGNFRLDNPSIFTFGGDYDRRPASFWSGTHPRGVRVSWLDYDFPGLESFVAVDGRLNDASVLSRGWSAEVLFPWVGLAELTGQPCGPDLDLPDLRAFVGRFQQVHLGGTPHVAAWCLQSHGVLDTHMPERFVPMTSSGETKLST